MKHLLYTVVLLLCTLGCSKFEGEYTINCQFTPNYGEGYLLLVTDYKGDVIGKFDIPEGTSSLSEKLKVTDENLPDYYDLHLIDTSECLTYIYSQRAVPNGANVFMNPKSLAPSYTGTQGYLQIQGIESLDSLDWIGWNIPYSVLFSQSEKKADIVFFQVKDQGVMLRLRANGLSEFRTLYVPANTLKDTINVVNWQDFQAESSPLAVELPGNEPIDYWEVDGLSPDFKQSVKLKFDNGLPDPGPVVPQFNPPAGWSQPLAYRIKIHRLSDEMEKIFMPGEPLRFEATDMRIDEFTVYDRNVTVKTSGDVDLIQLDFINLHGTQNQQLCGYFWQVAGPVDGFDNIELPNLKPYLPTWPNGPININSRSATAIQFGGHDYPQIREGFPYKSTEPFAVARSGYRAIRKDF